MSFLSFWHNIAWSSFLLGDLQAREQESHADSRRFQSNLGGTVWQTKVKKTSQTGLVMSDHVQSCLSLLVWLLCVVSEQDQGRTFVWQSTSRSCEPVVGVYKDVNDARVNNYSAISIVDWCLHREVELNKDSKLQNQKTCWGCSCEPSSISSDLGSSRMQQGTVGKSLMRCSQGLICTFIWPNHSKKNRGDTVGTVSHACLCDDYRWKIVWYGITMHHTTWHHYDEGYWW